MYSNLLKMLLDKYIEWFHFWDYGFCSFGESHAYMNDLKHIYISQELYACWFYFQSGVEWQIIATFWG